MKKIFLILFSFCAFSVRAADTSPEKQLADFLFPAQTTSKSARTETILVSKDEKIIFEKSSPHFSENTPHILWSVTKSVSSLIVGVAVQNHLVGVNESVCQIAPQFKDKIDCKMKLSDILEWSSGLNFYEAYEANADRTKSSVGQMLYGDGKKDAVQFVLSHRQIYPPGTHYYYSTGDSTLQLGILKSRLSSSYKQFPFQKFFNPLGLQNTTFETDNQGQFMSGSSLMMSSRDLLRIGQLVLHRGEKLVSPEWIDYVTTPNPQFVESKDDPLWIPCRQWWRPNLKGMKLHSLNLPQDIIVARGHWGQYLIIIPSQKLVAVRFGLDQNDTLDQSKLIQLIAQLGAAK